MQAQSETSSKDNLLLPQPGSLIRFRGGVIWYDSNRHGFKAYKENKVAANHVHFVVSCIAKHPSEYITAKTLRIDGWCEGLRDTRGLMSLMASKRMLITVLYRGKLCLIQTNPKNVSLLPVNENS